MHSTKPTVLYRYESYLGINSSVYLRLCEFQVIRATRQGVWIDNYGKDKFVLLDCRKQYAYEDKDKAFQSFQIRKKFQVFHLKRGLELAEASLKLTPENAEVSLIEEQCLE